MGALEKFWWNRLKNVCLCVCEKSIHAQELVFHEEFIETLLYYEGIYDEGFPKKIWIVLFNKLSESFF